MTKTVQVRHIDGYTFTAPARGKVLKDNYRVSEERQEELYKKNFLDPTYVEDAILIRAANIEADIEATRIIRLAEQREMPRYYDYNAQGKLWKNRRK